MSIEKQLHPAHMAIMHVLLFEPHARFAKLQIASQLGSDHFNFYLKQLVNEGFVAKNDTGTYSLTSKGKEFANRIDTDARQVERQPKVSVCLMIRRDDGMQLVQQRKKQPYYGYWGRPTGKIRWGESILAAAARELKEETGLAGNFEFESVYHKQDYNQQTGELLEDKIFFMVACYNPKGKLKVEHEGSVNAWMTQDEYANQPLSFESTKEVFKSKESPPGVVVVEAQHQYEPSHY